MRIAFKEWASVVDALGTGRQIIILRKGGISEGRAGFQVEHPEFLLFPTLFHQQRQSVIPEAQKRYDEISPTFPSAETVRIEFFCRIALWRQLEDLAAVQQLEGQHIWRPEVVAERFDWGRSKAIFALAVRTFRLPQPNQMPMAESYGGCKSWVELQQEVDVSGTRSVLSDDEFGEQLQAFEDALRS